MKYIKYLTTLLVVLFAATACETDLETAQLSDPAEFKAPVLNNPGNVVVNASNLRTESVVFTCTPADFGVNVGIQYCLYFKLGDLEALVGRAYSPSISLTKLDLNGAVVNSLKVKANEAADIEAYMVASIGETEVKTASSNVVKFNVKTYEAPLRLLYVPGHYQGWDPAKTWIYETGGGTNIYEGMFDFIEDATNSPGFSGFKFNDTPDWDTSWGFEHFSATSDFTSSNDGNLMLPAGKWQISVNISAMSIEAKKVTKVGLLGAFGGWEAGEVEFVYDAAKNVWVSPAVTFGAEGLDFLVRLNEDWNAGKYGDSGEKDPALNGVKLTTGGGNNIFVPEAGTYVMTLYADRTPYVLVMNKQ